MQSPGLLRNGKISCQLTLLAVKASMLKPTTTTTQVFGASSCACSCACASGEEITEIIRRVRQP
eukprot:m.109553 g.109553  ORF g.109553 m.109553 type:complete len:64 (+) comp37345_c0_seq1:583-774(+)